VSVWPSIITSIVGWSLITFAIFSKTVYALSVTL
jgi:hypothetical protein